MKLFIVATFIAIASAGRLEHLERSYLPPDQGSSFGSHGQSGFGSGSHGFSGNGFGSSGSFDTNGIDTQSAGGRSNGFGSAATINQYLPPNHGPSSAGGSQFAGSLQGFGSQPSRYTAQSSLGSSQYSPSSQYGTPSQGSYQGTSSFSSQGSSQFGSQGHNQYGSQGHSQFGSQGSSQINSQYPSASRQYLAPKSSSNYPQQSFDEQTGYHY